VTVEGVSLDDERMYRAITSRAVRFLSSHPQYEDALGVAHLEVWRRLMRYPPEERGGKHRLVAVIARQAGLHFLRSPANDERTESRDGVPIERPVPLHQIEEFLPGRAVEPDFAPVLIELLWRRQVWQEAWAAAAEVDRQILSLYVVGGLGHEAIGKQFGRPCNWSWRRVKRIFATARAQSNSSG
jgi:DNA-directed RNA polymerase specialized sigma24 family protein